MEVAIGYLLFLFVWLFCVARFGGSEVMGLWGDRVMGYWLLVMR